MTNVSAKLPAAPSESLSSGGDSASDSATAAATLLETAAGTAREKLLQEQDNLCARRVFLLNQITSYFDQVSAVYASRTVLRFLRCDFHSPSLIFPFLLVLFQALGFLSPQHQQFLLVELLISVALAIFSFALCFREWILRTTEPYRRLSSRLRAMQSEILSRSFCSSAVFEADAREDPSLSLRPSDVSAATPSPAAANGQRMPPCPPIPNSPPPPPAPGNTFFSLDASLEESLSCMFPVFVAQITSSVRHIPFFFLVPGDCIPIAYEPFLPPGIAYSHVYAPAPSAASAMQRMGLVINASPLQVSVDSLLRDLVDPDRGFRPQTRVADGSEQQADWSQARPTDSPIRDRDMVTCLTLSAVPIVVALCVYAAEYGIDVFELTSYVLVLVCAIWFRSAVILNSFVSNGWIVAEFSRPLSLTAAGNAVAHGDGDEELSEEGWAEAPAVVKSPLDFPLESSPGSQCISIWKGILQVVRGSSAFLVRSRDPSYCLGTTTVLAFMQSKRILTRDALVPGAIYFPAAAAAASSVPPSASSSSSSSDMQPQPSGDGDGADVAPYLPESQSPSASVSDTPASLLPNEVSLTLTYDESYANRLLFGEPDWQTWESLLKPVGLFCLLLPLRPPSSSSPLMSLSSVHGAALSAAAAAASASAGARDGEWKHLLACLANEIGFESGAADQYQILSVDSESSKTLGNCETWTILDTATGVLQTMRYGRVEEILHDCRHVFDGQGLLELDAELRRRILTAAAQWREKQGSVVLAFSYANHIFTGMVNMTRRVKAQVPQLQETLDGAGIRLVLFSESNERQTKFIGSQLGVESDWNSCISLATSDVDIKLDESDVKAQLPHGVDSIMAHLDAVDDVPLLVSLFCDCQPAEASRMLKVLQSHGDRICCASSGVAAHLLSFQQCLALADYGVTISPSRSRYAAGQDKFWPNFESSERFFSDMVRILAIGRWTYRSLLNTARFWTSSAVYLLLSCCWCAFLGLPPLLRAYNIYYLLLFTFLLGLTFHCNGNRTMTGAMMRRYPPKRPQMDLEEEASQWSWPPSRWFSLRYGLVSFAAVGIFIWILENLAASSESPVVWSKTGPSSQLVTDAQTLELFVLVLWQVFFAATELHRTHASLWCVAHNVPFLCVAVLVIGLQCLYVAVSEARFVLWKMTAGAFVVALVVIPVAMILGVSEYLKLQDRVKDRRDQKRRELVFHTRLGMHSPV